MAARKSEIPARRMRRYLGLVLRPRGSSLEEHLDPYRAYGVTTAHLEAVCSCSLAPARRLELDREFDVMRPLILQELTEDNARERWAELQSLWNRRHLRLRSSHAFGHPQGTCSDCQGTGVLQVPFAGAFDYYDGAEPDGWLDVIFRHNRSEPTWELPGKHFVPFAEFGIDLMAEQRVPEAMAPRNPCSAGELLVLCESAYIPAPQAIFGPDFFVERSPQESRDEWQLRVWQTLLEHRTLEASVHRFAHMSQSERPTLRKVL